MKIHIGDLIEANFGENTMTYKIDGNITAVYGKYAIVPFDEFTKLCEKNIDKK